VWKSLNRLPFRKFNQGNISPGKPKSNMKKTILRRTLCVLALSLAGKAVAADNGSLFQANEFDFSVSGEATTGNVHLGTYQQPVYSTSHAVLAPSTPTPTSVITIALRHALRTSLALKPLTATAGGPAANPAVTIKSRRIVQPTRVEHGTGGGSVEAAWFFTRYFGVALEGDFLGGDPFTSELSGQFIARYPFEFGAKPVAGYSKDDKNVRPASGGKDSKETESTAPSWGIAPYVIAGGGSQWDGRAVGLADVGGGVEVRFACHWGVFTDARWFVRNGAQHYTAVRAGVTYEF
jgi:hypothetical protein